MAKISKHGGPTVDPDQNVTITRPEIGYVDKAPSPIAEDATDAALKDAEDARAEEEKLDAEANKPSPKKAADKKR